MPAWRGSCTLICGLPRGNASGKISRLMESGASRISGFWLLVALIIGILIVGDLTRRMTNARRMEREAHVLATAVASLEASNSELEAQIASAADDASVAHWARTEAKLVLDGERLVVPIPAEEPSQDLSGVAAPELAPPTTWQIWWALLLGG